MGNACASAREKIADTEMYSTMADGVKREYGNAKDIARARYEQAKISMAGY